MRRAKSASRRQLCRPSRLVARALHIRTHSLNHPRMAALLYPLQRCCKGIINIAVCKTQMPPFPNIRRVGLTFDLLTWMSIGIIYSSRTIYLPSLKLQGQSVPELSIAQGLRDWHDLWPWPFGAKGCWVIRCTSFERLTWPLTFDLLTWISIVWSLWGKELLSYPLHKVWKTDMIFDLDLWPTDLTINRDHLLIKDYLPSKFEASGAKRSWVISCTRFERLTWPLTLTFDLLTWLSIGIIYSPRTIYLPSLKLLGQSVLELSVAQG